MDEPLPTRSFRVMSIALALLAAGALAYASVSHAWAIEPVRGELSYGLRERQDCGGDGCYRTAFIDLAAADIAVETQARRTAVPSSTLRAFGWVTSIASWIAAGMLVISALLVAVNRLFFRPIAATTLALLALIVGMIGGCVFVAQAREIGTVGWSFWMFGVAVVVGIVAAQRLARFKPGDPFWDHPPPVTDDPDKW